MHQTYRGSEVESAIKEGAKEAIKNNPVALLFPPYYVTQYAKSFLTTSQLTPDEVHNNEGLPCIMGAYSVMKVLCDYIGMPCKVLGNPLRIDSEIYSTLNIPGANGSIKTTYPSHWKNAQISAIRAVNASIGLWNSAREEMFDI